MTDVPEIRIQTCNAAPVRPDGEYVLYWMTAFRRLGWNFALEHAADRYMSTESTLRKLRLKRYLDRYG